MRSCNLASGSPGRLAAKTSAVLNALRILGFVDDDPMRHRLRLGGYSVLGDSSILLAMIARGEVDCVVLNTRTADVDRLQALEAACRMTTVDVLRLEVQLSRLPAVS